jgi:hypothetical protein
LTSRGWQRGVLTVVVISVAMAWPMGASAGWVSQTLATLPAPSSDLAAVSCVSSRFCVATGAALFASGIIAPLVVRSKGAGWQAERLIRPRWAQQALLTGISCSSESACTAVGQFVTWRQRSILLVERWDGSVWRRQRAPLPAGFSGGGFNGVSCDSRTSCTAVGDVDSQSVARRALAERWNGKAWSTQFIPGVTNTDSDSTLGGVACSNARACVAVGSGFDGVCQHAIATIWDGGTWSTQVLVQPDRASCPFEQPFLSAVSCASPRACAAVGGEGGDSAPDSPLTAVWNGTTWTVQYPPAPDDGGDLNGVSCPADDACIAVGTNGDGTGPFADAWQSTSWSALNVPDGVQVSGVSCVTPRRCAAVGDLTMFGQAAILVGS